MINEYLNKEKTALCILDALRKDNYFPYVTLSNEKIHASYLRLCNKESEKLNNHDNSCLDVISYFHPSIYKCNISNKPSIYEAYFNDELLFKCIMNRLTYINKEPNKKNIIQGFNVSKIAPKISIFKPDIAKYLIKKYLNNYNIIFDPCCGYSGRMLGCCSLNKHYIGQDINPVTIEESIKLKEFLNLDAELFINDSLVDHNKYDCLFTCPPYLNKEKWNQEIKILSAEEWIDILIHNFTCKTYLFVVDNPGKYKKYVVEEIINKSHFSNNKEYIVLINNKFI